VGVELALQQPLQLGDDGTEQQIHHGHLTVDGQEDVGAGGDALAEQYYNDAVRASIRFWSDVNKTGNPVSESTVERFLANIPYDGTLESILDQKYVALFWTGFEAWHEYRRTGYPALVIGEGTQNDHVLPTRMAYPTIAIKTNPDNYAAEVARLQSVFRGADDMKTPVWWSAEAVRKGIE